MVLLSLLCLIGSLVPPGDAMASCRMVWLHAPLAALSLLLLLTFLVSDYFTAEGINEAVLYHLRYGLEGAGFAEYRALITSTIFGVCVSLGVVFWWMMRRATRVAWASSRGSGWRQSIPLILVSGSLLVNPATTDIYHLLAASSVQQGEFDRYYARPHALTTGKPARNLVLIYAESLERTYFDESRFPGLIQGLRQLERDSVSFTAIRQLPGTGWTIAGMVASQCGLPLFSPSHGNALSGMDRFLPAATCLGDLLHHRGYHLAYYGGASLEFAGKGNFYQTHQFDEVKGRRELLAEIPDKRYQSGWGLFDDTLFDLAYRRFEELSATGERFALFLLTLDTHHPEGHPSRSCSGIRYRDGTNPILNAVACSDFLISRFVERIRQSPFRDDTVVVVMSDHLAMRNTAWDRLISGPRSNLFMIFDPSGTSRGFVSTPGSTLDVGTTVLSFLGYRGRIGLGRDLRDDSPRNVADIEFIQHRLGTWQQPVMRFWSFPVLKETMEIDADRHMVSLDGRAFRFPCLIEFSPEMETTIRFQFDAPPEEQNLMRVARQLEAGRRYVLIERCTFVDPQRPGDRYCLVFGNGTGVGQSILLEGGLRLSADELRKKMGMP